MKILWIATKAPWPAVDGGRLLVDVTLESLNGLGHRVTLVAPLYPSRGQAMTKAEVEEELSRYCAPSLVSVRPKAIPLAGLEAQLCGVPFTIARHSLARVRRRVFQWVTREKFDVVHVEQIQALPQAEPARLRGYPIVLRAQNVESDLWLAAARTGEAGGTAVGGPWLRWILRREAEKLARWEGQAAERTRFSIALTSEDSRRLTELSGRRVRTLAAPFPSRLPHGPCPLPGEPAVVLPGSAGWSPNRDATHWFLSEIWPTVKGSLPGAMLHLFGTPQGRRQNGVVAHSAPDHSEELFSRDSILVVPLRVASGVRMKILEAWARGVPVVATPAGASGLRCEDGRELLLARDAGDFVRAFRRIHAQPELRTALVRASRMNLRANHDPESVTRELVGVYEEVAAGDP